VAVCYQALRQYPEMASSLEEAVRLDPSTKAWFPLGEAYAAQNNRQKLVEVYERPKTLRPDLADEFFRSSSYGKV
jgi:tetratricopeptide (TPR) repeat protein